MSDWPALDHDSWAGSCEALHLWTQIAGKYRLSRAPWLNHSWHATLYVTPRGLTTGPVPDAGGTIALTFDLREHRLVGECSDGTERAFALEPMSVAGFATRLRETVEALGGSFDIHGRPNEISDPVPFAEDRLERPYDADAVRRFHAALVRIELVFSRFRTGFVGKASPAHLFWGSFDLAVTRFSGRPAPPHPGGVPYLPDVVTREAYSHEVSSAGFWPGNGMPDGMAEPMFYAYAYPVPEGFSDVAVEPAAARWDAALGEFLLPYEAVRASADPDATLMAFLQSTYEAAALTGDWDRALLECPPGRIGVPRPPDRSGQ